MDYRALPDADRCCQLLTIRESPEVVHTARQYSAPYCGMDQQFTPKAEPTVQDEITVQSVDVLGDHPDQDLEELKERAKLLWDKMKLLRSDAEFLPDPDVKSILNRYSDLAFAGDVVKDDDVVVEMLRRFQHEIDEVECQRGHQEPFRVLLLSTPPEDLSEKNIASQETVIKKDVEPLESTNDEDPAASEVYNVQKAFEEAMEAIRNFVPKRKHPAKATYPDLCLEGETQLRRKWAGSSPWQMPFRHTEFQQRFQNRRAVDSDDDDDDDDKTEPGWASATDVDPFPASRFTPSANIYAFFERRPQRPNPFAAPFNGQMIKSLGGPSRKFTLT